MNRLSPSLARTLTATAAALALTSSLALAAEPAAKPAPAAPAPAAGHGMRAHGQQGGMALASLSPEKQEIARAHSEVVGEALKSARIDIVGGENDFFQKVVRAVGTGKSVDRLVHTSDTLTDIKNTFFNGDPDYFKTQLRQWVKDFGISTEDLRNLTVSALLAKLLASTKDNALGSVLRTAQEMAKASGLSDVLAATLVDENVKTER